MTDRDKARLVGVHGDLVRALAGIFEEMEHLDSPMFVVQGVRTVEQQQAIFALGRTAPGMIVTMKDGVRHPSNHQPRSDGAGHAVDCAFVGGVPFAMGHPWEQYGEAAERRGLIWGGRWNHPTDSPHVELPMERPEMRKA